MLPQSFVFALGIGLLLPSLAAAQNAPLPNQSTGEERVMGAERSQPRTPFQQLADRLKLDAKTQVPEVDRILSDAVREAGPIAARMLQLRQQLVNLSLANKPDDARPVLEAYTSAAATMTGIEARAFAKINAMLKPNQQAGAAQAFAIMAGMFQTPAPSSAGARAGQRSGAAR